MTKFKIGDKVKIKKINKSKIIWFRSMDFLNGKTVNIINIRDKGIEVEGWWVSFDCLTLIEPHYKQYIGKKYAVHCKTQEDWDRVTKISYKEGLVSPWGVNSTERYWKTCWEGKQSCFCFKDSDGSNFYRRDINDLKEDYTILSVQEFFGEEEKVNIGCDTGMPGHDRTVFIKSRQMGGRIFIDELADFEPEEATKQMLNRIRQHGEVPPAFMGDWQGESPLVEGKQLQNFLDRHATNILFNGFSTFNKPNIIKKTMSKFKQFTKNLKLNPDEKELRNAGLQDDNGNWTALAREEVLDLRAISLGYKNEQELADKMGESDNTSYSPMEYQDIFSEFGTELLENAKKFNKDQLKK